MAILNDLIAQIESPELRARIQAEVERLNKQKKFGLVFEEHLPECTPLYDIPVKVGGLVAKRAGQVNDVYKVLNIKENVAECIHKETKDVIQFAISDLVSVAEFGEPIYPYLKPLDTISNAPDNDLWHTLIEADNYHALQLLEYLYAGKVDCIYIDPPYNTGARDWKYNNDYVDGADAYRHSKWLSFMQKRLKLAKKLLNQSTGVLILTIDEHEVHHIRCLMEEIFTGFYIQMVTCVTNPTGSTQGRFSRIEEYAIYCFAPNAFVNAYEDPMIGEIVATQEVRWKSLLRSGPSSRREDRKNMFYPVYVDKAKGTVVRAGEPLPFEESPSFESVDGMEVAWPIRTDGTQGRWSVGAETLNTLISKGYVLLGRYDEKRQTYGITYISSEIQKQIETGEVRIIGRNEKTGVVKVEYAKGHTQAVRTVWHRTRHNAGVYGTNIVTALLGKDRKFPFPKSVYVTKDSIGTILKDNPNALVVDFFAGSGTTLHAVNLLNAEDGGNRRCIIVTNNEVSAEEAKQLLEKGFQPGDDEWNALGIARYVTWPRTVCSIKGQDINGTPLSGNYLVSDTPMANGFKANAIFFKLGFLDKNEVALGKQFRELMPVLWMKAGAIGTCPAIADEVPSMLILPKNKFAVLIDEKYYMEFVEELDKHPEIETVYIVTDSESGYRDMISIMQDKNTYQLYRDYLDNFRINSVRR